MKTLQVHHIVSHADVREHHIKNLLLTCANCHQKIENGAIPICDVYAAKFRAEDESLRLKQVEPATGSNVLSFNGSNTGIVANTVTISGKSRTVKPGPISGTIGSNLAQRNYIKHLIDRHHEFKAAEVGKRNVNYTILYAGIKRKFGAKWDNLPSHTFGALTEYLQKRVDDTIMGKVQKSRGIKNYSSFGEHCAKADQ